MPTPSELPSPEDAPRDPNQPKPERPMPDLSNEGMGSTGAGGTPPGPNDREPGDPADRTTAGSEADREPPATGRPDLGQESFQMTRDEGEGDDVFARLQDALDADLIAGMVRDHERDLDRIMNVAAEVDQSLAPPIDARAIRLITAAVFGELPPDVGDALRSLSVYYDTWDEAFAALEDERDSGYEADVELVGDEGMALPADYARALEAGIRVRLEIEKQIAPPVDDRAMELIRGYLAGTLGGELADRVGLNIERFLTWERAAESVQASADRTPTGPEPMELRDRDIRARTLGVAAAIDAIYGRLDQSLAPPLDDEARLLIRLTDRGQLVTEQFSQIGRMTQYYDSWGDAFDQERKMWAAAGFPQDRLIPEGEVVVIPPHILAALEAGDRLRMEYERTKVPPVDAKAREIIKQYVAGQMPEEATERIDALRDRSVTWELAIVAEYHNQGKIWGKA